MEAAIAAAFPAPQLNIGAPGGAQCNPAVAHCYSYEWAIVNNMNVTYTAHDIFTRRTDFLSDARRQRTEFKSRYAKLPSATRTASATRSNCVPSFDSTTRLMPRPTTIRPLRRRAARRTQFMLAAGMIFHF
jgi:hypothetical protein